MLARQEDPSFALSILASHLATHLHPDTIGELTSWLNSKEHPSGVAPRLRNTHPVPVRQEFDHGGFQMTETSQVLRAHAEDAYAAELAALAAVDDRPRPPEWRLSPWAVATYLLGGTLADGTEITPKYVGSRRLIEIAVATLATDRALLLLGVPGTAKTWVSEHLAAAISGSSTLVVQGTAGTPEEALRYGWNYARLLAEGPSRGGAGAQPGDARHGDGHAGPHRGADPHPRRRAGLR